MRIDYEKWIQILLIFCVVVSVFLNIRQCSSSNKKSQYYIDKLNDRSKKEIEKRELHITKLLKIIEYKNKLVKKAEFSIDSLEKVKSKVEYVYINKVQQINNFNSKQLENYWKDEIK
jgi:hypothetical protein